MWNGNIVLQCNLLLCLLLMSSRLVQQGEDQGAKSLLICASDLLSGCVQQIEEGGCALRLQLKMKHDNISRVENYRA